jgi:hypothetical protein
MASSNPVSNEELEELMKSAPVRCLNVTARTKLSQFLNPPRSVPARCGIIADWRGVAELRDFQYQQIQNFQLSLDPTARLLDEYDSQNQDCSVQSFLIILKDLERFDVLEEVKPDIGRY